MTYIKGRKLCNFNELTKLGEIWSNYFTMNKCLAFRLLLLLEAETLTLCILKGNKRIGRKGEVKPKKPVRLFDVTIKNYLYFSPIKHKMLKALDNLGKPVKFHLNSLRSNPTTFSRKEPDLQMNSGSDVMKKITWKLFSLSVPLPSSLSLPLLLSSSMYSGLSLSLYFKIMPLVFN